MLSNGKKKINVMIINVHQPYFLPFQLLAQAIALDIVSLFIVDYLWQFVLRQKIKKEKARGGLEENEDQINVDDIGNNNNVGDNEEQAGEKNNVSNTKDQSNHIHEAENDVVSNEKYKLGKKRARESIEEINEGESQSRAINKTVTQKSFIKWTDDLHAKFMKAIQYLGEGKCYPKEILEMMNVPGLTRMQVASHLQKCRRNNWRSPNERKSIRHPSGQGPSSDSHAPRCSFRKFGTMPRLQINVPNLQCNPYETQRGLEFPFPTLSTNKIFAQGESSIQQLYRQKLHVQPHYFIICNPFNNPFSSAQTHQQQHASLFGMLGSQGPQGPITGNTDYRPGLTLDNGDHHTLSGYSLDLNVAQGATYSGSGLMSGIDVGNATINDYTMKVKSEFDQVHSDDQEAGIANYFDESSR